MLLKRNLKKEVKGSVLFTVVAVMSIMVVLVMAALTFAADATRRSYYDYYESQATYTARSLVDATLDTLRTSDEFSALILSELDKDSVAVGKDISLTVNGKGVGENADLKGYGEVKSLTIQYVGNDAEYDPANPNKNYNLKNTGKAIYKITAVVDYYSATSVTYSQYVIDNTEVDPPAEMPNGNGGFITTGDMQGSGSTNIGVEGPMFAKVMYDLDQYKGEGLTFLKNERNSRPTLAGMGYFNSSVYINTQSEFRFAQGEGMVVLGNFFNQNSPVFSSTFERTAADTSTPGGYKNLPYLYVEKTLYLNQPITVGSLDHPMNIFCGRLRVPTNDGISLRANVYCYNQDNSEHFAANGGTAAYYTGNNQVEINDNAFTTNEGDIDNGAEYLSVLGNNNGSPLLQWYAALTDYDVKFGGNFYTMGSVVIRANKKEVINGDMYIAQGLCLDGNATLEVKGDLIVGGSIVGDLAKITAGSITQNAGAISWPEGMSKTEITTAEGHIIPTPQEVRDMFYREDPANPGVPYVINSVSKPGYNFEAYADETPVYTNANIPKLLPAERTIVEGDKYTEEGITNKITRSCTISGTIDGGTIYISPSSDEIWINLVNFKTQNDVIFIIQDNKYILDGENEGRFEGYEYDAAGNEIYEKDATGNIITNADGTSKRVHLTEGKKRVNFFVPSAETYSSAAAANYVNSVGNASLFDGNVEFSKIKILSRALYTDKNWNLFTYMDSYYEYYPEINLYMPPLMKDVTIDGGATVKRLDIDKNKQSLKFRDQNMAAIHIFAPTATFVWNNSFLYTNSIRYNTESRNGVVPNVLGSINVGYCEKIENDFVMLYLTLAAGDGGSGGGDEGIGYGWDSLPGHALYQ